VFSGFSLPQIGEFSYIIAALGLSLGVIEPSLYQIIILSSILTIFATPYMMKLANPAYNFLERTLPQSWQNFLNKDSSAHLMNEQSLWKKLLKEMITMTLIYYFICIVIVYFALLYEVPFVQDLLPGMKGNLVVSASVIILLSPFMRAIIIKKDRSEEFRQLWAENKNNRGPLIFTILIRVLMSAGLIMFVLFELFHTHFVVAFTLAIALLLVFVASSHLKTQSISIERRFKENYHEKEKFRESKAPLTKGFVNQALERDLHLSDFTIVPRSLLIGKTLKELDFKQSFGVNIVTIIRNDMRINIPGGNERIYPGDHVVVFGTDKQMEAFQKLLEERLSAYAKMEDKPSPEVQMNQIQIGRKSHLQGKTIRNSGIKEKHDCLIIGIERNNTSMQNPDLDLILEEGDILWLIGEYNNIMKINNL
jgi:CPA2 family monovalent cation:H+ antiporter-2